MMRRRFFSLAARTAVLAFGLSMAPLVSTIGSTGCGKPAPAQIERDRKQEEAELLARLPNLKSMSDMERFRLFERLKEIGGEATVRALVPMMEVDPDDPNRYRILQTLETIGAPYLPLLVEAAVGKGSYLPNNAVRVIGALPIPAFEKLRVLFGFYTHEQAGSILFQAESGIKDLLKGKLDPPIRTLITETYDRAKGYGKYALLNTIGEIRDPVVVQILTRALGDLEVSETSTSLRTNRRPHDTDTDPSTRERAARLLQEHANLPPETIDAVWARLDEEKDPDVLNNLLLALRDHGEIPRDTCNWSGSKSVTKTSDRTLHLHRSEGLYCTIPKRRGPKSEKE